MFFFGYYKFILLFFILIFIIRNKLKRKIIINNNKLIGISFGPTGGYFSYTLGVAKYIQEEFILDNLVFAGTSGGVQPSLTLSMNIPVDIMFNNWLTPLVNEIKDKFIFNILPPFNMFKISKKYLSKNLVNYDLSKLNNKFYVGITKIFPYPHNYSVTKWINNFDDFYDGLCASQYLPFLSGYPLFFFRDFYCIDGYFTNSKCEPISGKWLYIDSNTWNNKNKTFISGLIAMKNIGDINFHLNQYKLGYENAKRNHKFLLKSGLIEK